jgi:hypothetical protein
VWALLRSSAGSVAVSPDVTAGVVEGLPNTPFPWGSLHNLCLSRICLKLSGLLTLVFTGGFVLLRPLMWL